MSITGYHPLTPLKPYCSFSYLAFILNYPGAFVLVVVQIAVYIKYLPAAGEIILNSIF
jgi:hypothetical protein